MGLVWKQKTPASGKYPAQVIENMENVQASLYGFGGPAAWCRQFAVMQI